MQWLSSAGTDVADWMEAHDARRITFDQTFAGIIGERLSRHHALRAAEIANLFQIHYLYPKRFDECSSGERQLIQIVEALLDLPSAIVLIEPFRFLDGLRREYLMLLLERLERLHIAVAYTDRTLETSEPIDFRIGKAASSFELQMTNVSYRHPLQPYYAIQDVEYRVSTPGLTVCIGSNGSGKSTLLELMAKMIRPLYGKTRVTERAAYLAADETFGPFPNEANRRLKQLQSVFEARRALLLLDEPTVGLTSQEQQAFLRAVTEQAKTARVICATHDRHLIRQASEVIVLSSGRIVFQGTFPQYEERSVLWSPSSSPS